MPKELGQFLKELLTKAGIEVDKNEALTTELSAPSFTSMTISEEMERGIDNGLLSLKTAINDHPDVKKVYFAKAYNGVDSEINSLMDEMQIDPEVRNVILNERSSTKRIGIFAKKIKELEEKKKATTSDTTRDSLQKTINQLNAEIAEMKGTVDKVKQDYEGRIQDIHKNSKLESLLNQYKTVYDDLPGEVKSTALMALISNKLQDSDAELKLGENKQLILVRRDGSNVFGADNRQLTPQSFIDATLAQNKVLKVTDSKPNGQNNNSQQQNGQTQTIIDGNGNNGNNGTGPKKDTELSRILKNSMSDLENAAKTSVL